MPIARVLDNRLFRIKLSALKLLQSAHPSPSLRRFVRAYAQRSYTLTTLVVEPSTPCVEPVLAFYFGDGFTVNFPGGTLLKPARTTIVGPNLSMGIELLFEGSVDLFAVFFLPSGFSDLFGVPLADLTNNHHDAADLVEDSASLWHELADAGSFATRVRIAEEYLSARAKRLVVRSSDMHAANQILRQRGVGRIGDLAFRQGLGVRQYERRFAAAVGATPKAFARVARFQSALDSKLATPLRTWCDIAHSLGYHDQMHLIHDFEQIGGNSPQQLLSILGDARPPALAQLTTDNPPHPSLK